MRNFILIFYIGLFVPIIFYKIYQGSFHKRFMDYLRNKNPGELEKWDLPPFMNWNLKKEVPTFKFYTKVLFNQKPLPHDPFLDREYKKMRIAMIVFFVLITLHFFVVMPYAIKAYF